jgi:hypothetical protein
MKSGSSPGERRKAERRAASAASSARWREKQKERGLVFFQRWLTLEQVRRISPVVRGGARRAERRNASGR